MRLPLPLSACLLALAFGTGALLPAADAKPKFESPVVRQGLVDIDVDVTGAKQLVLVVGDGGDGFAADWADWVDPVLVGPAGETKLTDLKWTSARTGWGTAQLHKNVSGGEMKVAGKAVDGIGVHAISVVVYDISGKGYTRFKSKAGPDNGGTDQNGGGTTSVQFYVFTETPPAKLFAGGAGGGGGKNGLPPEDSVEAMTMAEGLSATLWASEPMFCNPTDIDVDAAGRVWVDEGLNYRQWHNNRPAGDRIVVMEDSSGKGKADKIRVFYQGTDVNAALGMCVLGDKIIVSDSPNVFIFTDNGEGKPPTKELFFTGIEGVQHDHGMHTFVFGPDGKLYFNFGNAGVRIKDKNGKPIIDIDGNEVNNSGHPYRQGMVFRCNLDGSEFEVLGHNFRNNYEVNVDSFGTLWQSDNDDDGNRGTRINYVMEHGNFGYTDELTGAGWGDGPGLSQYANAPQGSEAAHLDRVARHWHLYDPGVVPNLLNTGAGSPTGILVYEGELLPPAFRNMLIHCEPGSNVVRSYQLANDGAGYKAETLNIMKSRDSWFRPSDVCVAPDGALIVADWFDPGVGGHQMGDNNPDTAGGRLFRIAPTGAQTQAPKLDLASGAGAVRALCSPNLATRYLAWTKLHELGAAAEPELIKLWHDTNPRLRARALWLLTKLADKGPGYVKEALKDVDPDLRITALRAARQIKLDVIPLVSALVKDASPQVRRECAITLRHNQAPEMPELWAALAVQHDGVDRWAIEALGIGADKRWDECFKAWQAKAGDGWNTPTGRDIVWRARASGVAALLSKIILDPATPPLDRQRFFRAFDFQPAAERDAALVALLGADGAQGDAIRLEAAKRIKNADSPQIKAALAKVLDGTKGTPAFVALAERFKIKDRDDDLLAYAIAHPAETSGVQALRLVMANGGTEAVAKGLSGKDAAAVAALLGNANDQRALPLLQPLVADAGRELALRQEAVRALGKLEAGAHFLLDLSNGGKLPSELKPLVTSVLLNAPWEAIRSEVAKKEPAPEASDGVLPSFAQLAKKSGDVGHGEKIFSGICVTCHQVNGKGIDFGPNLSEIGTKLGKDALYESVVVPDAGIEFNYETTLLTFKDGNSAIGIVISDTEQEVALKAVGAIVTKYKKSDIASRTKQKNSLMPTGLQRAMSQQDLVDLIEYLAALKKK